MYPDMIEDIPLSNPHSQTNPGLREMRVLDLVKIIKDYLKVYLAAASPMSLQATNLIPLQGITFSDLPDYSLVILNKHNKHKYRKSFLEDLMPVYIAGEPLANEVEEFIKTHPDMFAYSKYDVKITGSVEESIKQMRADRDKDTYAATVHTGFGIILTDTSSLASDADAKVYSHFGGTDLFEFLDTFKLTPLGTEKGKFHYAAALNPMYEIVRQLQMKLCTAFQHDPEGSQTFEFGDILYQFRAASMPSQPDPRLRGMIKVIIKFMNALATIAGYQYVTYDATSPGSGSPAIELDYEAVGIVNYQLHITAYQGMSYRDLLDSEKYPKTDKEGQPVYPHGTQLNVDGEPVDEKGEPVAPISRFDRIGERRTYHVPYCSPSGQRLIGPENQVTIPINEALPGHIERGVVRHPMVQTSELMRRLSHDSDTPYFEDGRPNISDGLALLYRLKFFTGLDMKI